MEILGNFRLGSEKSYELSWGKKWKKFFRIFVLACRYHSFGKLLFSHCLWQYSFKSSFIIFGNTYNFLHWFFGNLRTNFRVKVCKNNSNFPGIFEICSWTCKFFHIFLRNYFFPFRLHTRAWRVYYFPDLFAHFFGWKNGGWCRVWHFPMSSFQEMKVRNEGKFFYSFLRKFFHEFLYFS